LNKEYVTSIEEMEFSVFKPPILEEFQDRFTALSSNLNFVKIITKQAENLSISQFYEGAAGVQKFSVPSRQKRETSESKVMWPLIIITSAGITAN
jgi:hypothetical protein